MHYSLNAYIIATKLIARHPSVYKPINIKLIEIASYFSVLDDGPNVIQDVLEVQRLLAKRRDGRAERTYVRSYVL